jgi:peptidyl-prolyl cis-trans isomerase B (cyclophilin B)
MRSTCSALAALLLTVAVGAFADVKPFEDATLPPERGGRDETSTGRSIIAMRDAVKKEWDNVVFEKDGKKIEYRLTLETDEGKIIIEFLPDVAPNHVRSMICLAKAGYYDGLIFHRCIPGFMIQGGCPYGQGMGGPGYQLKEEFNDTMHERGVLSAARSQSPDSAGSQFFLCHKKAPHLDRNYTAFGKVVEGLDVIDKIVEKPRDGNDRPFEPVKITKATVSVKGEEKKTEAATPEKKEETETEKKSAKPAAPAAPAAEKKDG